MEIKSKRKRHTATERELILQQYRRGETTQREFAREQGIGLATLCKWLRRAGGRKRPEPAFIPVPNLLGPTTAPAPYRIVWPAGLALEVRPGFQPQELARLLPLLAQS